MRIAIVRKLFVVALVAVAGASMTILMAQAPPSGAKPLAQELTIGQPVFASKDAKEGPRAFAEKRKPAFEGR